DDGLEDGDAVGVDGDRSPSIADVGSSSSSLLSKGKMSHRRTTTSSSGRKSSSKLRGSSSSPGRNRKKSPSLVSSPSAAVAKQALRPLRNLEAQSAALMKLRLKFCVRKDFQSLQAESPKPFWPQDLPWSMRLRGGCLEILVYVLETLKRDRMRRALNALLKWTLEKTALREREREL
ncbi:unnamed protein product, partial [Amoebophrya sp. A25]